MAEKLPRPAHQPRAIPSHVPAPALDGFLSLRANQGTTTTTTRFALGRIVVTPRALRAMKDAGERPLRLLKRHAHGDCGNLHEDDVRANELAIRQGMRVLSAFVMQTGEHVWVLTEADRSATTILLPDEHGIEEQNRTSKRSMKNTLLQVANE